jgi:hypothetical protein
MIITRQLCIYMYKNRKVKYYATAAAQGLKYTQRTPPIDGTHTYKVNNTYITRVCATFLYI